MENIKKFEPVIYWYNGIMKKGRILDITLENDGSIFYIEDFNTHEMFSIPAEQVTKE